MPKKAILTVLWFPLTIMLLMVNISYLASTSTSVKANKAHRALYEPIIAVSQGSSQIIKTQVEAGDGRSIIIKNFLLSHNAPLAEYADILVQKSDEYNIDYRLTTAIAMCESLGGKRVPLRSGYNPFGIAVYTNTNNGKNFDNWEHAIDWVSKYIKERYFNQGITDLTEIGVRWAPPSINTDNSWAKCVQSFIDQIH